MSELKIISNYHTRELIYGYELPFYNYDKKRYGNTLDELKNEFNWLSSEEFEYNSFFIYKQDIYCLDEFMDLNNKFLYPNRDLMPFPAYWDGYLSDSFFSGILIHLDSSEDFIIVGTYFS